MAMTVSLGWFCLGQYAPYNWENLVWLKYLSNQDSVLGREGVERQVTTRVNNIIEGPKKQLMAQQRQVQKQEQFEKIEQQHQRKVIKM